MNSTATQSLERHGSPHRMPWSCHRSHLMVVYTVCSEYDGIAVVVNLPTRFELSILQASIPGGRCRVRARVRLVERRNHPYVACIYGFSCATSGVLPICGESASVIEHDSFVEPTAETNDHRRDAHGVIASPLLRSRVAW